METWSEIMKYSIEINTEDLTFIIEAIKLRAFCLADDVERQAKNIKAAHEQLEKEIKEVGERIAKRSATSELVKEAVEAKVIPEQKRKTPYGYKRDGTPKKRPGRPRLDELPF
jgi:hypothetical protein